MVGVFDAIPRCDRFYPIWGKIGYPLNDKNQPPESYFSGGWFCLIAIISPIYSTALMVSTLTSWGSRVSQMVSPFSACRE